MRKFIVSILICTHFCITTVRGQQQMKPITNETGAVKTNAYSAKGNRKFYPKGDILRKKHLGRVLDLHYRPNFPLDSLCYHDDCNVNFTAIISEAIKSGMLKIYTHPNGSGSVIPSKKALYLLSGGKNHKHIPTKYLILEDITYSHILNKIDTKITAIGPVPNDSLINLELHNRMHDKAIDYKQNGNDFGTDDSLHNLQPLFWINYADLAPLMMQYMLKKPLDASKTMNCLDFFENKIFFGQLIKMKEY
jgi:hypothetical protein